MNIGIIGTGHFALAIAYLLEIKNYSITFIGRDINQLNELKNQKSNSKYTSYVFKNEIKTQLLETANYNFDIIFYCLPTACLNLASPYKNSPIIFTCKGFANDFIFNCFSNYAILAGGSYASEIMRGIPCYLTIASNNQTLCNNIKNILISDKCLISINLEPKSIEVLGIFKNILAIFCGIINELDMGKNIEAAFISKSIKGLNKIVDFDEKTLVEPAGIGDLFLSCSSIKSRNYSFGKKLIRTQNNNPDELVEGYLSISNMKKIIKTDFIINLNIIIEKIINKEPLNDIKKAIINIINIL